jgi:hypothetical protein
MGRFHRHDGDLERMLRAQRSKAPDELVSQLVKRVPDRRGGLRSVRRVAAAGFSIVALTGATALGGASFAMAAVHTAAGAANGGVHKAPTPAGGCYRPPGVYKHHEHHGSGHGQHGSHHGQHGSHHGSGSHGHQHH